VLVVARFVVADEEGEAFLASARDAVAAFAAQPGYLGGRLGRAADDPTAWVLTLEWSGVGAYRRSLSAYGVRMAATPLLGRATNEPTAYEVLYADGPGAPATRPSGRAAAQEPGAPPIHPSGRAAEGPAERQPVEETGGIA